MTFLKFQIFLHQNKIPYFHEPWFLFVHKAVSDTKVFSVQSQKERHKENTAFN